MELLRGRLSMPDVDCGAQKEPSRVWAYPRVQDPLLRDASGWMGRGSNTSHRLSVNPLGTDRDRRALRQLPTFFGGAHVADPDTTRRNRDRDISGGARVKG
jgi:hypothetical protein